MSRLDNLENLKKHPYQKRLFKGLSSAELSQVTEFIRENEHLSADEYAMKVSRWLLDQPKPKHFSAMWAIALESK